MCKITKNQGIIRCEVLIKVSRTSGTRVVQILKQACVSFYSFALFTGQVVSVLFPGIFW